MLGAESDLEELGVDGFGVFITISLKLIDERTEPSTLLSLLREGGRGAPPSICGPPPDESGGLVMK